jgi:hypothetical protein
VGIVAFVVGLALGVSLGHRRGQVLDRDRLAREPPHVLQASLTVEGDRLLLTNHDVFPWEQVTLRLNPHWREASLDDLPRRAWYSARVPSPIVSGRTVTLPLRDFAAPDGTRFDPSVKAVVRLDVTADTPQGPGAWTGP